ncbi:hypothetical protein CHO01_39430 [Cellulomonas hominis]|uniref:Uncharacterized protein n=1 Tax=Cellulomonas hominis TaxID=156981 RepID=A0A511FK97_9CELL|nr:hypothetical protein [Cellulomonas hominis]MBB5474641.1 hypothetical protein [Cellulomonas hominis]NKY06001.1 hypothetical protein [Cellulomonas hominis]GEL48827.1 hypothetical protein CHO01_39430 [Cellulomonas hominis]
MSGPALVGLTGPGARAVADVLAEQGFRPHDAGAPARHALTLIDPLLPSGTPLGALVDSRGWAGALLDRTDGPEVTRLLHAVRHRVPALVLGGDAWLARVRADMAAAADLLGGAPVALIDVDLDSERAWVRAHGGVLWHAGQAPDPHADVWLPDLTGSPLRRRVERELARAAHPPFVACTPTPRP